MRMNFQLTIFFFPLFKSLTLTDSVVKTYRNYVILYTLKDVLIDVLTCI